MNGQPDLPDPKETEEETDTPLNKLSTEIVSKLRVDEPDSPG